MTPFYEAILNPQNHDTEGLIAWLTRTADTDAVEVLNVFENNLHFKKNQKTIV